MCLILAPTGRDADIARMLLERSGLDAVVCANLAQLHASLSDDVGLVVIADEALRGADLEPVATWVRDQPSWSDLPFVVLTRKNPERGGESELARLSSALGNVTFVERPFRPGTFESVIAAERSGAHV